MLGGMLAGHDECDGDIRYEEQDGKQAPVGMTFYGMSSETAMKKHSGGVARDRAAEGKSVEPPIVARSRARSLRSTGGGAIR